MFASFIYRKYFSNNISNTMLSIRQGRGIKGNIPFRP